MKRFGRFSNLLLTHQGSRSTGLLILLGILVLSALAVAGCAGYQMRAEGNGCFTNDPKGCGEEEIEGRDPPRLPENPVA